MSEQNVQLVREIYATWAEGEIGRRFLAGDVEWVNPSDALEPGTRQGIEGFVVAINRVFDVWKEMHVEPDRLFEHGDQVVMTGRIRGIGPAGLEATQPHGHVWTVRDGKVTRLCWFSSGEQALEAVGLPSP